MLSGFICEPLQCCFANFVPRSFPSCIRSRRKNPHLRSLLSVLRRYTIFVVEREQLLICEMNSWWCWLGRHRTFHKSVPARRNCVSTFNSINVLLSSYCRVNRFFFTNEFAPRRAWIVERRFFGRNLFSVLVFLSGTDAMQKAKSRDVMKFELRYAKLASLESEDIILSLLIEFCTYDLFESVHL